MSKSTIKKLALFGMGFSLSGIVVLVGMIIAFNPALARAQDPVSMVTGAAAVAEQLPDDVTRLAMIGIIVLAMVVVAIAGIMQRIVAVKDAALLDQTKQFTTALNLMAGKPCMYDTETGKAIIRDKMDQAFEAASSRERNR